MQDRFSSENVNQINEYLAMNLEDLYQNLGQIYLHQMPTLTSPKDETSIGKELVYEFKDKLFSKICKDWQFCSKRHKPDLQDTINLVATIADLISSICIGFPPILISTIIVKKGLTKLCKCNEL